jgi:micrococcal nuclease
MKPFAFSISALIWSIMVLMVGCDEVSLPRLSNTITGNIVGVHDGDSCTLLTDAKEQYKIRLDGIDAPELGQSQGRQAKVTLSGLVMGREVTVRVKGKDRYERTLGVVTVDGKNVNLEMVRLGYAWHYLKYSKDLDLAVAEKDARDAKRGLWADRLPVPPWDWRRR